MGRGRRGAVLSREIPLSDADGRTRLRPHPPSLPALGLRVSVQGLGDGFGTFAEGERPLLRLRDDEEVILVYGQQGRTLVGHLGDTGSGALLARLMREGRMLQAEVVEQGGGWGKPLRLELLVEAA